MTNEPYEKTSMLLKTNFEFLDGGTKTLLYCLSEQKQ
jgi:hypothetical protein